MKKFIVEFYNFEDGATSPIDNITAADDYTADQYLADCKENADDSWNEMLEHGQVTLVAEDVEPEQASKIYVSQRTIRSVFAFGFEEMYCEPMFGGRDSYRLTEKDFTEGSSKEFFDYSVGRYAEEFCVHVSFG